MTKDTQLNDFVKDLRGRIHSIARTGLGPISASDALARAREHLDSMGDTLDRDRISLAIVALYVAWQVADVEEEMGSPE